MMYYDKNYYYHDMKKKTKENIYCDKNHCYHDDGETKEIRIEVLMLKLKKLKKNHQNNYFTQYLSNYEKTTLSIIENIEI